MTTGAAAARIPVMKITCPNLTPPTTLSLQPGSDIVPTSGMLLPLLPQPATTGAMTNTSDVAQNRSAARVFVQGQLAHLHLR